jgi:formyltetrahydrofolate deformylase
VTTHLLLVDCPDQPGLIARITAALYRHGFNILSNQEFVDTPTNHFFMRTAFAGSADPEIVLAELRPVLPPTARLRLASREQRPIVILATRESHCLGDLLLRHAYEEFPARIMAVISNYATLAPLVQQFNIPFHHIPHQDRERLDHERALLEVISSYDPAYLVLAKYMRVLSPSFVARYPYRMINIHHSFLPAFIGARPYHQAFSRGVKIIGATAHFVTDDLDTGPIIAQDVLAVNHSHSAAAMAQAGRDIEKTVLAKALRLVLEERVFVQQHRTIVFA